jgi:hypothetical protein
VNIIQLLREFREPQAVTLAKLDVEKHGVGWIMVRPDGSLHRVNPADVTLRVSIVPRHRSPKAQ